MQTTPAKEMPLTELVGNPKNPRKISNADLNRLCDSIRQNGFWEHRPIAVERQPWTDKLVVLDGNQRLKALRRLKRKTAPVVVYSDLTDQERDEIILRSNINNGKWEAEMLQVEFDEVDFDAIGLEIELPEPDLPKKPETSHTQPNNDGPSDEDDDDAAADEEARKAERLEFFYRMIGDFIYPSDNEYQIPALLLDKQPVHLELPLTPWGAEARYKKGISTYHFYVDDYRFEQLFKNPIKLLLSGCKAIVEPNVSIHDQTPVAYAIYQIYRKRYLCRYLQECGIQVWADLNVSPHFAKYNRLGIPDGYNAFFTRGVTGWLESTEADLQLARQISGCDHPNLCVYGGGADVAEWCQKHQVVYVNEYINHASQTPAEKLESMKAKANL